MPERSEGQKLVDMLVSTASINAELETAQREAREDAKKATDHIKSILGSEHISTGDILDIVHGTDPNGALSIERKRFEKTNSRPSLLEVAQLAFHNDAQRRVTAFVGGRAITVTNLNPDAEQPVIKVPVLDLDRADLPDAVTGTIANYYSQIDHVILESADPIFEHAADYTPLTEDDLHAEQTEPQSTRTVSVQPVRRVSPYTNEFVPQVSIDIQEA